MLRVSLSRAETNELFLSGDSMVSWPVEGLDAVVCGAVAGGGAAHGDLRLERSGIFVSEIAARPAGLALRYQEQSQAERAATLLGMQFSQIGIKEET